MDEKQQISKQLFWGELIAWITAFLMLVAFISLIVWSISLIIKI